METLYEADRLAATSDEPVLLQQGGGVLDHGHGAAQHHAILIGIEAFLVDSQVAKQGARLDPVGDPAGVYAIRVKRGKKSETVDLSGLAGRWRRWATT